MFAQVTFIGMIGMGATNRSDPKSSNRMFAEMTCYLPKLIYPVYPVSNQTNLAVPPREAGASLFGASHFHPGDGANDCNMIM